MPYKSEIPAFLQFLVNTGAQAKRQGINYSTAQLFHQSMAHTLHKRASVKNIETAYFKYWGIIISSLKAYIHHPQAETLHEMRVAVKKLVSLLHLLEYCHPGFNSHKILKPVEKAFHISGTIRDSGNAILMVDKYNLNKAILQENEAKAQKAFGKLMNKSKKYLWKFKQSKKKAGHYLKDVSIAHLRGYLLLMQTKIEAKIQLGLTTDNMHELRKEIKEMGYLGKITGYGKKARLQKWDKLQDHIGKWHDLEKFHRKLTRQYKPTRLKGISRLKKDETALFHKINKLALASLG